MSKTFTEQARDACITQRKTIGHGHVIDQTFVPQRALTPILSDADELLSAARTYYSWEAKNEGASERELSEARYRFCQFFGNKFDKNVPDHLKRGDSDD